MARRLAVVTPEKSMLQNMGFSCETEGNWSSREKESKVLHLDYGMHSSATYLIRDGTDLSAHTYASEEGRESNRFLAYSRCWNELGPLQFGMEDDTVNLIGVQGDWGTYN